MVLIMILDKIENCGRYSSVHPQFALALDYLQKLSGIGSEKVALDGEDVLVLFSQQQGKKKSEAFLEAHKMYIDIHFCFEGREKIGWRALSTCAKPDKRYDAEKDFMTFSDEPESWSTLTPGTFAVYFPDDAHAPMVSDGVVKKAVVKVSIEPL